MNYADRMSNAEESLALVLEAIDDETDPRELAILELEREAVGELISTINGDYDALVDDVETIVVTRHDALVAYLLETGVITEGEYTLVAHVSPELVQDKHVIGILPHSLSVLTRSFTEVPLSLPAELRGKELTIEDMRKYAQPPVTYKVTAV